MAEIKEQAIRLNDDDLSPEEREKISIEKFVLDLVLRWNVQDYFDDDIEKSFQVPFFLNEHFNKYTMYSLLFFRNILFESEYYMEEYIREYPKIAIYSPMFKCFASFVKEEYDLKSKRSSMLNQIPFLNFIIKLFNSVGVEVKVNDYLRDENGNILVNQLLAISYEQFNMCGIVSSDLSIESEEEWRNCIFTSHIMQRKHTNTQRMFSLCFIIHGCKITFFYSHQPYSLDYFLFNKIQTWDFCNADHLIEIVGCLFMFINLSWMNSKTNPFGYIGTQILSAMNTVALYEQKLKEKLKYEEERQQYRIIKEKHRLLKKKRKDKKIKFTESVIDQLLKCTITK
ncbi:predicted protein [Naegleria gruberi]|uniref:Predicted protein n=1 Tax=Naegleria gruberi TaxID=5762 RepID=D2W0M1_NAEGR|nr:uncharacterized protein NAEGRDRAFT_53757 [Naegleria gruberi]EFC37314.1 predicted protein [Naegleria gruberi]|eukprot:XP_002670058.1 predicted protein [Naegleria gruberi strain NEG-M]